MGGHAAWQEYDTAPRAWPRSVLLAPGPDCPTAVVDEAAPRHALPFRHGVNCPTAVVDEAAPRHALPFRHGVTGGDVMHLRTTGPLMPWLVLDLTRPRCEPDEGGS